MLQQITEEIWKNSKILALKVLLIKRIYHFNTLHLYPAQTRKRTKKELPNSSIKLLTYRHLIFTENEGLVQIKVILTSHDFGPDYTLH